MSMGASAWIRNWNFWTRWCSDGRALELENIAPILQKLAGDEAVLQRVQRRARALLAEAKND